MTSLPLRRVVSPAVLAMSLLVGRVVSPVGLAMSLLVRRVVSLVGLVAVVLAGWASPASAHAGGLVATDARSRVVSVTPSVPGMSVATIEDGAKLRLVNGTASVVAIPPGGGPAAPATVAAGHTAMWADSRTSPVGKRIGAGAVRPWTLVLEVAGAAVTVTGVLEGASPPAFVVWWGATLALVVAIPVVCRRSGRSGGSGRSRRGEVVLAGAGLVAMAASIAHVTGSTMEVVSAPALGTFVSAAGVNLLAWPLILGGAVAAYRGRPAGLLAVCAGAALTAVSVLPDVTSFHRAVLPFAGPDAIERVLVVLALGAGVGTAVAGGAVLRGLAAQEARAGEPA
ncbi:hypothetical protein ODJ79_20820 [Actinoplanes sp. KI2]|uniref:hypothetical protein n=1 Tax=Actinoplanes sp. KI2 TaxID=2983315 RepID=UPI0021D5C484|nr:hypothetical protein [Actinoplanes sp. KI2]MCU7726177.1 hypothetical protein [Actinoplanes sp. KI2]